MFEVNDQEMATRAKEAKLVRKIVFFVVVGIVVVLTAVIGGGAYYVQNALEPVNPDSDKTVKVYIERGSSVTEIAQQLESRNIINSSLVFRYYVKYKNAGGFQAGTHTFSPSMPIDEVIDQLRKTGKAKNVTKLKLTFAEGLSLQDIAGIIAEKTDLQKHDILKKMKDRKYIKNTYMDEYWFLNEVILDEDIRYPLEGYLFPATYSFKKENPSLETIIKKMLDKMGSVLKQYEAEIKNSGLKNVHDLLTLASMIEEEGTNKKNRRKISSVFHNRLKKGMPLQSNPTVNYATGKHRGWIEGKEITVDSPYNTYKHQGLPAGPISNPGKVSIAAALHPAKTDYLYFVARVNGEIVFSKTYEKHQQAVEKYEDEWEAYIEAQKNKK